MICYRDMTFCGFYLECEEGEDCGRAMTDKIIDEANAIHLPIASYLGAPECFKEKGCKLDGK
jgi:hypothetical protein